MSTKTILVAAGAAWAALGLTVLARATAGELDGVTLADQVTVEGRTLVLNGMGLRQATILRVRVYVAGLYLEARSSDASQIIASEGPKRLALHFVRDVGRGSLIDAWKEGFAKSAGQGVTALQDRLATLNAWMVDVKPGDAITFTQVPGRGIVVEVKGEAKGTLPGADFARALWGVWLGAEPPNAGLKKGLLGG
jgi:hypothetical protein